MPAPLRQVRTQLARPRVILAAKSALAVEVAWLLAPFMPGVTDDYPYYAPLGALVCMYPTVMGSARLASRALLGLATGILIAGIAIQFDVAVVFRLPVIIAVAVLVGGLRIFGSGRDWIAVAALFVLVVGGGQAEQYSIGYLSQMALGVVVGLSVNFLLLPPIFVDDAAEESDTFRLRVADHLDELADLVLGEAPEGSSSWAEQSDGLAHSLEQLRDSVRASDFSQRGNLRAARYREQIAAQSAHLRSLERVTLYTRDLTETLAGAAGDDAVPETVAEPVQAPIADLLRALAEAVRAWRTPRDEGAALDDARSALEEVRRRAHDLEPGASLEAAGSVGSDARRIVATIEAEHALGGRGALSAAARGAGAAAELRDDDIVGDPADGDVGQAGAAVGGPNPGVGD